MGILDSPKPVSTKNDIYHGSEMESSLLQSLGIVHTWSQAAEVAETGVALHVCLHKGLCSVLLSKLTSEESDLKKNTASF